MADLPELEQFDAGVFQLETETVVLGGPDGPSNAQAKALANRTKYLKAQLEDKTGAATEVKSGILKLATIAAALAGLEGDTAVTPAGLAASIAALVDSSPGALDTLNELAAALGDDANFATTMTNALADKSPWSVLEAVITEGGIVIDRNNITQLRDAINNMIASALVSDIKVGDIVMQPHEGARGSKWMKVPVAATVLPVATYPELAAVYGTDFGGDGIVDFGIPHIVDGGAVVQSDGDAATTTIGEILSHLHAGGANYISMIQTGPYGYYASQPNRNTYSTGGPINAAGGLKITFWIKLED